MVGGQHGMFDPGSEYRAVFKGAMGLGISPADVVDLQVLPRGQYPPPRYDPRNGGYRLS